MKRLGFSVIMMLLVLTSCKSKLSTAQLQERSSKLQQISSDINDQGFEIVMNTAYPLSTASLNNAANGILLQTGNSANRINLTDRHDFIKRKGNEVSADLSFFGERQISAGYLNDAGIKFTDTTKNYSQVINEEDGTLEIQFTAKDENNEHYPVRITLQESLNADVNITSSHRTNIRYTGTLKLLAASD